jgi:hypothetical protein
MSHSNHRSREYSAQQMFSTYHDGQNVGDAYGEGISGDAATGLVSTGVSFLTGLVGMGVAGAANKKNRQHEAEMAQLNADALAISAKSQEMGMIAQMQAGAAANKRAITYASAGFASVVILGSLAYLAMRKRKA